MKFSWYVDNWRRNKHVALLYLTAESNYEKSFNKILVFIQTVRLIDWSLTPLLTAFKLYLHRCIVYSQTCNMMLQMRFNVNYFILFHNHFYFTQDKKAYCICFLWWNYIYIKLDLISKKGNSSSLSFLIESVPEEWFHKYQLGLDFAWWDRNWSLF